MDSESSQVPSAVEVDEQIVDTSTEVVYSTENSGNDSSDII